MANFSGTDLCCWNMTMRIGSVRSAIGVTLGVVIGLILIVTPASAAVISYWQGNHAAGSWKSSSLRTVAGGHMFTNSGWHHAKMRTVTSAGAIIIEAEVFGAGQVNYSHAVQSSRRVRCIWQPYPYWSGQPVSVFTNCSYKN